MIIREVTGREVLDSRGFPTVYARVVSEDGAMAMPPLLSLIHI